MSLNEHQQRLADGVRELLVQKDAAGKYVYSKTEVRDFIAVCVFEAGLPIIPELEGAMVQFLAEVDFGEDADDEEVADAVRAYFQVHPLNPKLRAEFEQLCRGEIELIQGGFQLAEAQKATLRTLGQQARATAPRQSQRGPAQAPKPKRGIPRGDG